MSSNIINSTPYLRTSRDYPVDNQSQLILELTKTYIDVAQTVNNRTIGIYPTNGAAITGNSYYFSPTRQQSLREMYSFTSTGNINLGFKLTSVSSIIQMYGTFTDGTNTYGLIPQGSTAISGQIGFYLISTGSTTTDQIKFVTGGGAPALTSGAIVIEWISNA